MGSGNYLSENRIFQTHHPSAAILSVVLLAALVGLYTEGGFLRTLDFIDVLTYQVSFTNQTIRNCWSTGTLSRFIFASKLVGVGHFLMGESC